VVRKLRRSGLSVTDTATILGVSRGRISQLDKADPSGTTWTKKQTEAAENATKVAASAVTGLVHRGVSFVRVAVVAGSMGVVELVEVWWQSR